jgi:hypothetical protein
MPPQPVQMPPQPVQVPPQPMPPQPVPVHNDTPADAAVDPTLMVEHFWGAAPAARSYTDMLGQWYGIADDGNVIDCPANVQYCLDEVLRKAMRSPGEVQLDAINEVAEALKNL